MLRTTLSRVPVGAVGPATAVRALSSGGASGSGLSFQLSESQRSFQELARKFAKEEMIPAAAECELLVSPPLVTVPSPNVPRGGPAAAEAVCFASQRLERLSCPTANRVQWLENGVVIGAHLEWWLGT